MKRELIECFQDTQEMCRGGELEQHTRGSVAATRVYEPGFKTQQFLRAFQTVLRVMDTSPVAAAREHMVAGKTAILNCANPHFPGGASDKGGLGPEETLCRSTNLYPCLCHPRITEGFYKVHRASADRDFTDRVIYTPEVMVFKDERQVPEALPRKKWFKLDVISCAAPYMAKRPCPNLKVLKVVLKKRIRNIMEVAMDQQVDVLVIGPFGCGAFGNPPEIVAKAFKEVLLENRYRSSFVRVVFAIPRTDSGVGCPRLAAFQMELLGFSMENKKLERAAANNRQPVPKVRMPGGRIRHGEDYAQWRQGNYFFGKQFSILGDSVSTLEGFHPQGNRFYYGTENQERTGVKDWKDTWWGKTIDFFGGELLVNHSWSGTQVARMGDRREQLPSGCCDRRTGELHRLSVKPDVILVFMGLNDWARGVIPEPEGREVPAMLDTFFSWSYELMLQKLKKKYPKAEIWCATIPRSYMSENPRFSFPDSFGGYSLETYNVLIRSLTAKYNCALLDLYTAVPGYDTLDGTHANARGMEQLAAGVIRQMADIRGGGLLDCESGHEYANGVCRKCGKPMHTGGDDQVVLRLKEQETGKMRILSGEKIKVGRGKECQLLLQSPYVARSQAFFIYQDEQWLLQDDYSRNGTYLNGEKLEVDEEYRLEPGDVIQFARKVEFMFMG